MYPIPLFGPNVLVKRCLEHKVSLPTPIRMILAESFKQFISNMWILLVFLIAFAPTRSHHIRLGKHPNLEIVPVQTARPSNIPSVVHFVNVTAFLNSQQGDSVGINNKASNPQSSMGRCS